MKTKFAARLSIALAVLPLTLAAAVAPAAPAPEKSAMSTSYSVVDRIPMPGEGGWDYVNVDPASRRIYVSRGDRAVVVDVDSKKVLGEISPTPGIHGIAEAPSLDRGFTSNGRNSTVTVFSLSKLTPVGEVKATGDNPDAILYDPFSKRVFTFNGRGKNATAIDAETSAVAGTIALGAKPEFAVSDGAGKVFVNLEDTSSIAVIDPKTLGVTATWPLAPCEEPSGLAIDVAHKRLFTACHNKMVAVVDAVSGKVVTTFPIGDGVDAAAFDPATGLVFASCGDGTMTIAHEDSPDAYRVVQTVSTKRGARTMTLDLKTHRAYLMSADYGPRPEPTADRPNPRPPILPGTAALLVVAPKP
ncbi:MAG: YncE family protein [Acidobacteriota bacterium]|nr:YncE family protein [Acidobacteriota bacterium]